MKRILYITMNLNSGGAERQIVSTASEFVKRGYEVEIACFAEGDFYEKQLQKQGVKVHWMIIPNYIKRALTFRKFIRKGSYDAVISYLESSNFLNTFAAMGGRSWKVITGERSAQEDHLVSPKGKVFAWMQRYSDAIVCNSENARKMWLKHYPQYENKLKTIYNTITIQPTETEYVMRKDGKTHLLVAASYQRVKNPIRFVEAVNLLREEEKEQLQVDWYGQKQFAESVAPECEALVMKYGLENVIHFRDRTNNIPNLMYAADAVGLFSSVEGLPNTICEGLSLGKPIIMTRVSDYNTLVDENNGWLCDWDEVRSIKGVLSSLINCDCARLKSMGDDSWAKAVRLFSKETTVSKWMSLLD